MVLLTSGTGTAEKIDIVVGRRVAGVVTVVRDTFQVYFCGHRLQDEIPGRIDVRHMDLTKRADNPSRLAPGV